LQSAIGEDPVELFLEALRRWSGQRPKRAPQESQ
jgi:hypothetical protein